jgi:uncharacterized membrane protein
MDVLINRNKLIYLVKIFVPVFPILLILPQTLVIIGPNLLINLLSSSPHMVLAAAQYDVLISAGVFYLSLLAFENIEHRKMSVKKQNLILFLLVCCNILLLVRHPLGKKLLTIENRYQDYQYMQEIKEKIPQQASILAPNNLGGQLGQFPNLYLLDPPWLSKGLDAEYVVVDKLILSQSRDYSQNTDYELWESKGNIVVYKRISDD